MQNKFETDVAEFYILSDTRIKKKFKSEYQHLFDENKYKKLKAISHKNIIHLYEISSTNIKYLISEYFESVTLVEKLRQDQAISFSALNNIINDIAIGIDYLHSKNIVHQDII